MKEIIKLSFKERSELQSLLKHPPEPRQYRRALALLLLDAGQSARAAAGQLRVSRQTVYNWACRFGQRRLGPPVARLRDAPRTGRPATVQGHIEPLLERVIDQDPRDCGYNSTVWTAALLRLHLGREH